MVDWRKKNSTLWWNYRRRHWCIKPTQWWSSRAFKYKEWIFAIWFGWKWFTAKGGPIDIGCSGYSTLLLLHKSIRINHLIDSRSKHRVRTFIELYWRNQKPNAPRWSIWKGIFGAFCWCISFLELWKHTSANGVGQFITLYGKLRRGSHRGVKRKFLHEPYFLLKNRKIYYLLKKHSIWSDSPLPMYVWKSQWLTWSDDR